MLFINHYDNPVWYKDKKVLTTNAVFSKKSLATRFEQITYVHYQAASHTENQSLKFFLG